MFCLARRSENSRQIDNRAIQGVASWDEPRIDPNYSRLPNNELPTSFGELFVQEDFPSPRIIHVTGS